MSFQMTALQISALSFQCKTFGEFMEKAVKDYQESRTPSTMQQVFTSIRKGGIVPLNKLPNKKKEPKVTTFTMSEEDYAELSKQTGKTVEQLKEIAEKNQKHALKAGAAVKEGKAKAKGEELPLNPSVGVNS